MDLNQILTATQTLHVSFMGETINCEFYTAGVNRLTSEQQASIDSEGGPGAVAVSAIPLLLKSWDLLWKGEPLPVEQINETNEDGTRKYPIPLALVNAIWEAGQDLTVGRPTPAETLPSASAVEEQQDTATS